MARPAPIRPTTTSLGKGLALLSALGDAGEPLGLADLARISSYPKSTVHRLLATMAAQRYVEQLPDGRYAIGLRLFELGSNAGVRMTLRDAAIEELRGLASDVGETAHLGVLDGAEVVYIEKVESGQSIRMSSQVGRRNPLHCTGIGKALLAFAPGELVSRILASGLPAHTPHTVTSERRLRRDLAAIRERGWSADDEELELGLRCVGAPVFGADGRVEAALSIAGPTIRMGTDFGERFGPVVTAAAARVSAALGHRSQAGYAVGA
jgi:IclR family acetate operon transcriptional repressor